jgi:hypothetical protein
MRDSGTTQAAERASSTIHPARRTNIRYSIHMVTDPRSCLPPSEPPRRTYSQFSYLCPVLEPPQIHRHRRGDEYQLNNLIDDEVTAMSASAWRPAESDY